MRSWHFNHRTMDNSQFENRFSNEDSLQHLENLLSGPDPEETAALLDKVRSVLDRLPPREADFVDMYYFRGINQTAIARIVKVSQPTVCYRLQRASARILYLVNLPPVSEERLTEVLNKHIADDTDKLILRYMVETTCQSEAAKRLGVTQGFVRHRFLRSINLLRSLGEEMKDVVELFDVVSKNLNILREVQRPLWEDNQVCIVE